MAEKSQPLFDKYYDADEETFAAEEKDRVRRALQRKFQAAYDDADAQIDGEKDRVLSNMRQLKKYNVDITVNARLTIERLRQARAALEVEYELLFGEKLT